ncbi:hypothetical protein BRAT_15835 [Leptospira interrogans serovar Bratislava]|nr:hypothetical protein BRAT_15835 [Leptospira interrogans serovar Bratislava]
MLSLKNKKRRIKGKNDGKNLIILIYFFFIRVVEKFVVAINKTALINHFIKQKQDKELIFQQFYCSEFYNRASKHGFIKLRGVLKCIL